VPVGESRVTPQTGSVDRCGSTHPSGQSALPRLRKKAKAILKLSRKPARGTPHDTNTEHHSRPLTRSELRCAVLATLSHRVPLNLAQVGQAIPHPKPRRARNRPVLLSGAGRRNQPGRAYWRRWAQWPPGVRSGSVDPTLRPLRRELPPGRWLSGWHAL
jgi:hypothetical protein